MGLTEIKFINRQPADQKIDARCAALIAELDAECGRILSLEMATGLTALADQLGVVQDADDELGERIITTVATSIPGLLAQMRLLARAAEGEYAGLIAGTVIAGLEAMQAGA